jgi:hypothetical protein
MTERILEVLGRGSDKYLSRFAVRTGSRIQLVLADDTDWIGAAGDYAELPVRGRGHLLRETMNALEEKLDPGKFLRCSLVCSCLPLSSLPLLCASLRTLHLCVIFFFSVSPFDRPTTNALPDPATCPYQASRPMPTSSLPHFKSYNGPNAVHCRVIFELEGAQ